MEYQKIERGTDFDLFGVTQFCKVVSDKRTATDDECRAYARWLAMKAGIVEAVTESPKLEWKNIDRRGRERICMGAYFGDAFVAFPGADQNGAVTFELLDDAGEVATSGTIYAKPNGALNIAAGDLSAMKESAKAWAKANKAKAKAAPVADPIAEPAPVATVSGELETPKPERVRTVSSIIGGMPYGHLQDEHFIVGLGASFEWCEGPLDRWYSQREGRTAAYGEGYATKQEAIDNVDAIIATERAPETPQDAAPATTLADQPEIAPQGPENGLADDVEAQPDPIAALIARMDALESLLESVSSVGSPIDAMETDTPLPVQSKPKRSAAHIRAIMAYLAMRAMRGELASERKHNTIGMGQLDAMRAERDQLQASLETVQADSLRWQQQDAAREKADYAKRRRAVLKSLALRASLRREREISRDRFTQLREISADRFSAWQERDAAIAEGERLRKVAYQQAGHIVTVSERLDRAEAILRKQGPALSLVQPTLAVAVEMVA